MKPVQSRRLLESEALAFISEYAKVLRKRGFLTPEQYEAWLTSRENIINGIHAMNNAYATTQGRLDI